MTSQPSTEKLGEAVLQLTQHGVFPEEEDVVSATLSSAALLKLIEIVDKAQADTKNEVRRLARVDTSNVDDWIAQARKLQDDITFSQETAKQILQLDERRKGHAMQIHDASEHINFLLSEIAHKENLSCTIEQLRDMSNLLNSAHDFAEHGDIVSALQTLEDFRRLFKNLYPFQNTRPAVLLQNKEKHLTETISDIASKAWKNFTLADPATHTISFQQPDHQKIVDINTMVDILVKLELFDKCMIRMSNDLDQTVVFPRLNVTQDDSVAILKIEGDRIQCKDRTKEKDVKTALEDIRKMANFLATHLPSVIAVALSAKLVPVITSRLIKNLLLPAVPLSTDGIYEFQDVLSQILALKKHFDDLGWSGQDHLTDWVDKSAETWLALQKENAIAEVKIMFTKMVQVKKTVERIETRVVTASDALHAVGDEQQGDWEAEWEDEDTMKLSETQKTQDIGEENISAQGKSEEALVRVKADCQLEAGITNKEDLEDWGADWGEDWGNEETTKSSIQTKSTTKPTAGPITDEKLVPQKPFDGRKITLQETYTVTGIPDSIMKTTSQIIMDMEKLNSEFARTPFATASRGLCILPGLLLAMYRATAHIHYSTDIAGKMLIYNDCQRLSDRLRLLLDKQTDGDELLQDLSLRDQFQLKLTADIKSIEEFGKRAYGGEMESQRQIIRDHLEDAQGFQGCSNVPFGAVCDEAIATVIDRIGDVKRQWQSVLSNSALLQSLGSLFSTALTKFVNDVEDMSDIAEDESKKLHGYCNSLATLAQYFQATSNNGEMKDMVSVYTPNWFKFQWLSEILDSNLADIKHFWTNSELRLEMDADEVISLIEALFAPSDHRRKAISEIRGTGLV